MVADEHVDPEFGTGAVKVTPAHDPNDFEIGRRHELPSADDHGRARRDHRAPGRFDGLDRFEARPAVTRGAARAGPDRRREAAVPARGRALLAGAARRVEPRLSLQWFVKVGPLAKAAGDAVRDGRVAIHPAELAGRYFDWVDNMHDWCISRQLWWGHRIPVWYGPDGEIRLRRPGRGAAGRGLDPGRATCWTPGSPRRCGRSPPWAGRTRPTTCAPSTRPACWSPATTSCSSGSSG